MSSDIIATTRLARAASAAIHASLARFSSPQISVSVRAGGGIWPSWMPRWVAGPDRPRDVGDERAHGTAVEHGVNPDVHACRTGSESLAQAPSRTRRRLEPE
jgi:hypothetical protein